MHFKLVFVGFFLKMLSDLTEFLFMDSRTNVTVLYN